MRRNEEERQSDPAVVGPIGQRTMDGAFMMHRELARLQDEVDGLALVDPVDTLPARKQIVGGVGFDMRAVGPAMRSGQHTQASILRIAVGQPYPGRHLVMRLQAKIGGVLVPTDMTAVRCVLRKQGCAEQENVRPDNILDGIEDRSAATQGDERGKRKMCLYLHYLLRLVTDLALECLQSAAFLVGTHCIDGAERVDIAEAVELLDLIRRKYSRHFCGPFLLST